MKLLKSTFIFIVLISFASSCSNDEVVDEAEAKLKTVTDNDKIKQFEEAVAVTLVKQTNNKTEDGKRLVELELIDYSELGVLRPAYKFNGIQFSDTGRYNDKVAGDGIYTSVELIETEAKKEESSQRIFVSANFKYRDQLPQSKLIDCAISHVDCGNTSWIDSDWGTGWGCFEFSDCRVGI